MKIIVRLALAAFVFLGGPGSGDDRCLWPTNPNSPECAISDLPSQPA